MDESNDRRERCLWALTIALIGSMWVMIFVAAAVVIVQGGDI